MQGKVKGHMQVRPSVRQTVRLRPLQLHIIIILASLLGIKPVCIFHIINAARRKCYIVTDSLIVHLVQYVGEL